MRSTGGGRKYGATCSNQCRQWLVRPYSKLPADHWARWYGKTSKWKPPAAPKEPRRIRCAWCDAEHETLQTAARYCSKPCAKRASKARRRARETGAPGEYTWGQVIKLHLLAGRRCSYCDVQVAQPEPDHVVPISRGGRNDIGNILPCCQRCNGDKGDMTLTEWAAYRERRGKTPVRTEFSFEDNRFKHLVTGQATGRSRRLRTEFAQAA
nr:HNH endonuclease [Arthrobacter luteolus]